MSLFYLFLYVLSWGMFLWVHQKKIQRFGMMTLIASSYLIYAICSLYLYIHAEEMQIDSFVIEDGILDFFPFAYLFIMLYIFTIPITIYDRKNITQIQKPSNILVYGFLSLFLIANINSAVSVFSNLKEGIMKIMLTDSGGAELYAEAHDIAIKNAGVNILGFIYSSCSDLGIFFIFYILAIGGNKWLIRILSILLIMSLLEPISRGLRTETIMRCLLILSSYAIFCRFYPKSLNLKIRKWGIIGVIIIAIPTFFLSLSRFGNSDGGLSGGTASYIGQANLNFNNYCLEAGGIREGDRTANLFKQFLGFENVPEGVMSTRFKHRNMRIDDEHFYTFVGDFVLDYGPFITVFIFITFSIIFTRITKVRNPNTIQFSQLLWIYFLSSISIQGGFFLFNYSFSANWKIILFILMYIALKIDASKNRSMSCLNANNN